MTKRRLISVTAAGTVLAWSAAAAEAFVLLISALSGWCSDSSTDAQCSTQQNGAEFMAIFLTLIVASVALALIFATIRTIARPQFSRQRWYAAAAGGLLLMPVAVIATGMTFLAAFDHHGENTAPAIMGAILVQAVWLPAWASMFSRLTDREVARDARMAQAS